MKFFLFISAIYAVGMHGQEIDTVDLKYFFKDNRGGFSAYNIATKRLIQYNPQQCSTRYSPCSTFKIPHSLIGLQTGIIPDAGFIIKYDSALHPRDSAMLISEPFKFWFQDLTLKDAFKYSSVWYYQELAKRIGEKRMTEQINNLNYGNKDISSGIDNFWLCGSLNISINEQVEFLKDFYLRKFPGLSDKSYEVVKSIMLYESSDDFKLYGKTGSGDCSDGDIIGWYVGFVETDTGPNIFAMNIIVDSYDKLKNDFRISLTRNILRKLKIID